MASEICGCAAAINRDLAEQGKNTSVVATNAGRIVLRTEKDDSVSRKKPLVLVASFCPLCGKEYPNA